MGRTLAPKEAPVYLFFFRPARTNHGEVVPVVGLEAALLCAAIGEPLAGRAARHLILRARGRSAVWRLLEWRGRNFDGCEINNEKK